MPWALLPQGHIVQIQRCRDCFVYRSWPACCQRQLCCHRRGSLGPLRLVQDRNLLMALKHNTQAPQRMIIVRRQSRDGCQNSRLTAFFVPRLACQALTRIPGRFYATKRLDFNRQMKMCEPLRVPCARSTNTLTANEAPCEEIT